MSLTEFLSRGIEPSRHIRREWLSSRSSFSSESLYKEWLCSPLAESANRSAGMSELSLTSPNFVLSEPVVLEVLDAVDVSQRYDKRRDPSLNPNWRTLKLKLTDGMSTVFALELRKYAQIQLNDLVPGSKLFLRNSVVRRGVIMLEPACLSFLGGYSMEETGEIPTQLDTQPGLQRHRERQSIPSREELLELDDAEEEVL